MRILIALGGNAMTGEDGDATAQAQQAAVEVAMERVAALVAQGHEVVLTHGNGPQVGNLFVKNELAAHVVPPVGLDWCVAQTQATIGFMIANALERSLASYDVARSVATIVTRTRVDENDPLLTHPTKPIGRYVSHQEAEQLAARGQVFEDRGEKGWRRVVASPEPRETLDAGAIETLARSGCIVVASGGGGIPVVRDTDGTVRGVEAVIDKDLAAALLARTVSADLLLIATDVDGAVIGFGTPQQRVLGRVSVDELRAYAEADNFTSGSMGPKVEAAMDYVAGGGGSAAITSLHRIVEAVSGQAGTIVTPSTSGSLAPVRS